MNINNIKSTFTWFFEYVLIIATILECNSVLVVEMCTESTVDMWTVFDIVIISTAVLLLVLNLTDRNKIKVFLEGFFPVLIVIEIYAIIYYILGVSPSPDPFVKNDFIKKFFLMLPLYSSLLFMERREDISGSDRLVYKFSNIVCIMAFLNLIVYYMSTFHVDELESEIVYLRWYNNGVLSSLVNCLNICYLQPGTMAQSFNIHFLRDFGPFVEPLMFLIPLGTSLFVELFLREKDDKWCFWRCLLLSVTIFTVQSTYGLMMLVIAWGLKLIALCNTKERIVAMIPTAAVVLAGCGYFVAYKLKTFNVDLILERLMQNKHFTDYVYPIKAFLSKPLLAGGYLNNDLSISFFSEEALKDTGFSNSIAVVLGQGGIILGLLCMLPFLIGLLQIFSENNRKYALFTLGPLYLYTVTIFHYTYFLIFVFALGYSLLELERNKEKSSTIRLRMIQRASIYEYFENEKSFFENAKAFVCGSAWKESMLIIIIALLTVCYGTGLWHLCYKAMYHYQLTSGQSGIRVLYGIISLIALLDWCRVISLETVTKNRKFAGFLYAAITQIGYALAYSTIYSYIDTAIQIKYSDRELVRESLLLLCYLFFIVVAHIIYVEVLKAVDQKNSKKLIIPVGIIAFAGFCLVVGNIAFTYKLKQKVSLIEAQIEPLKKVTEFKTGKLYSDELPVLYRYALGDVTYGVIRGEGYRILDNSTIIEPKEKELTVLFNEGYQAAQISDDHIIYSNDESVISGLAKDGYKFYRYYAFDREYDLEEAARLNSLNILEADGEKVLLVEGEGKSLIYGPYDILQPGTYTATFFLKINPEEYSEVSDDTVIANVRTSHLYGQKIDQIMGVTLGEFDEDGFVTVKSNFTVRSLEEGYEYLVFGKDNYSVEICKIEISQTPKQITLSKYNVHQKSIYETYYDLEGDLLEVPGGYCGCEYDYDDRDLVTMQRFVGSDFKPVLINKGYAEFHRDYNNKKEVVRESYFGVESEPIELPEGYHSVEMEYDFSGNRIMDQYFDIDGNPTMKNGAFFKLIRSFDDNRRWIRTEYYDTEGNLVLQKGNYAVIEREYDDSGNVIEERYYGLQNEPVLYNEKYHIDRKEYDEKKQCIKELFFGTDGELILQSGGYYGYERSYDDAGNVIRQMYLGADEKPVITDWGYACWHRSYNSKKQIIREEYYDTEERRTFLGSGISAVEYDRDHNGNAIGEKYFGVEDEAVLNTSNVAEVKREFNDLNQKVSEEYIDLEGQRTLNTSGISRREYDYDAFGNCIMDCFYGVDNERVLVGGYWKVIRTYDENRKNIHEEYFGIDGEPVLISEKYAMVDYDYDATGKMVKKIFRDMDGIVVDEQTIE